MSKQLEDLQQNNNYKKACLAEAKQITLHA
jgi:hypothetical protein